MRILRRKRCGAPITRLHYIEGMAVYVHGIRYANGIPQTVLGFGAYGRGVEITCDIATLRRLADVATDYADQLENGLSQLAEGSLPALYQAPETIGCGGHGDPWYSDCPECRRMTPAPEFTDEQIEGAAAVLVGWGEITYR